MVQDAGFVRPFEVVTQPLSEAEELRLLDGELVGGDLLIDQPELQHHDDDDGTVDAIP